MRFIHTAAVLVLGAAAASAAEPLDVKIGLWETTATTQMAGLPNMAGAQIPKEALEKMPPEQRARVEAMMKNRVGGGMSPMTTKVCLTRESLANAAAFNRQQNNCSTKVVSSSASRQQVHIECDQGGMKLAGDFTIERVDAERTKGQMVMKGAPQGQPFESKMSFESKWLSADCGSVKPAVMK